jgi:hypothetical protein
MSFSRAATLPVNSKADAVTGYGITPLCPSLPGGDANNKSYTLRCAIEDANNDALAGTLDHTITFDKCGETCAITVQSQLPTLTAQGLTVSGSGTATVSGKHLVARGLEVNASQMLITGLTVQDFKYDGIDVLGSTHVQVGGNGAGNTLRNNGHYGIRVGEGSSDASRAFILSNRIYGNGKGGIVLSGLDPVSCSAGYTAGAPNGYLPCPSITSAKAPQRVGNGELPLDLPGAVVRGAC